MQRGRYGGAGAPPDLNDFRPGGRAPGLVGEGGRRKKSKKYYYNNKAGWAGTNNLLMMMMMMIIFSINAVMILL